MYTLRPAFLQATISCKSWCRNRAFWLCSARPFWDSDWFAADPTEALSRLTYKVGVLANARTPTLSLTRPAADRQHPPADSQRVFCAEKTIYKRSCDFC